MSLYNRLDDLFEEDLFEMANLDKATTGLPVNLWVDSSGLERDNRHSQYRIKMQNDYGEKTHKNSLIPISLDPYEPRILVDKPINIKKRDLKLVYQYITDNYNLFKAHMEGELTDAQLIRALEEK